MNEPKIITAEQLIDKHYEEMFEWLCDRHDTDFVDFTVELKLANDGKTIRRSWGDRDKWLADQERN